MSASEAKSVTKNSPRKGKPKAGAEAVLRVVEGAPVQTDPSRDALLTEFGKTTLRDRYLLPGLNLCEAIVERQNLAVALLLFGFAVIIAAGVLGVAIMGVTILQ